MAQRTKPFLFPPKHPVLHRSKTRIKKTNPLTPRSRTSSPQPNTTTCFDHAVGMQLRIKNIPISRSLTDLSRAHRAHVQESFSTGYLGTRVLGSTQEQSSNPLRLISTPSGFDLYSSLMLIKYYKQTFCEPGAISFILKSKIEKPRRNPSTIQHPSKIENHAINIRIMHFADLPETVKNQIPQSSTDLYYAVDDINIGTLINDGFLSPQPNIYSDDKTLIGKGLPALRQMLNALINAYKKRLPQTSPYNCIEDLVYE